MVHASCTLLFAYVARKDMRCVKGLNAFQGQYVWNGEAYCLELRNRFGISAFGVTAHGAGDALIKGSWFHDIRAEFGCLYPEGGTVTFPDMTQNLFQ